jgi:trans-2,3-dihydro-3-hydroxyanthranilate isomerase
VPDLGQLAAALSLKTGDIGGDGFVSERWNAGNGFTFVPVKGLEAIARARPDMGRWSDAIGPNDPQGVFLFCREVAEKGHSFHARMFAPGLGVLEDPATGSAAAAFAGPLSAAGPGDGQHAYTIEQGYEMGRPSLLNLTLNIRGGSLAGAVVGGDAVLVSEGAIEA